MMIKVKLEIVSKNMEIVKKAKVITYLRSHESGSKYCASDWL